MTQNNNVPVLYFIYGAPSVGKLTISKKLSEQANLSLFHNHLTFDVASAIYDIWSAPFFNYCELLRIDGIKRAILAKKSLIFTFCYTFPEDDPFVKKVIEAVEDSGGEIKFIHLCADTSTVLSRVENVERSRFDKINKKEDLRVFLNKYDAFSEIIGVENLNISTITQDPQQIVTEIRDRYKL
jgi:shikimate kinase